MDQLDEKGITHAYIYIKLLTSACQIGNAIEVKTIDSTRLRSSTETITKVSLLKR